jgi:hypothetical protein
MQQRLGEAGFTGCAVPDEGDGADGVGSMSGHSFLPDL